LTFYEGSLYRFSKLGFNRNYGRKKMSILDLFDLSDKVAIVSGGGGGLGRIMAVGLAEAGADVVVCSRKIENCEETAKLIDSLGRKSLAIRCDLTKEDNIDDAVSVTLKEFNKIDILINNAGRTFGANPEEYKLKDWKAVIDVNVTGTFLFCQRVGREMIKQQKGKIINISSYAGLGGTDPKCLNAISYNTSKGAVILLTKDLATKWAKHQINVNCIAPGWFPTKMTKWLVENRDKELKSQMLIKRYGCDEDIKSAAIYLSSKASNYVTGQVLSVDGGLSVWF
jgi:NAD(P)-dependent dehydrogenase (short-subunit alcohol dehydrogenase family)